MAKGRDSGMPPLEVWESFFDPAAVLDAMAGREILGDAVEFGCGYGTFTIAAASRVSGELHALDIDSSMVSATAARATRARARNVITQQRDFATQGSGRPRGSAAFAMLFNILHIEDPVGLLRETHRTLREGGMAGIIHWRHDIETPRGPPVQIRPRPEQCQDWAEQAGLHSRTPIELPHSPWHWGMMLEKHAR